MPSYSVPLAPLPTDQVQLSPCGDPMAMLYALTQMWYAALMGNSGCTGGARQSYSQMMCEFMPLAPEDYDGYYEQSGPEYQQVSGPPALPAQPRGNPESPAPTNPPGGRASTRNSDGVGEALDIVLQSYHQVAGKDGYFDRDDLLDVVADPNTPQALRRACGLLAKNPALFNALDQAADQNGELDGRVGAEDLSSVRENWRTARQAAESSGGGPDAARTVMAYIFLVDTAAGKGKRDEKIGTDDLQAITENPDLPPELRESAARLLRDQELYARLDTANGGKADGVVSLKDFQVYFQSSQETPEVRPPGVVETPPTPEPIPTPVPTPTPAEPAPVVASAPPSSQCVPDPGRTEVDRTFQVLESNWESLGLDKIDRESAAAMARDPNLSEDVRKAFQFLLDNPALFNAVDCANAEDRKLDGMISLKDVRKGREEWEATATYPSGDPYQVLLKYAYLLDTANSGVGDDGQRRDGKMGLEDLNAIASNAGLPLELREAASTIMGSQEMMNRADTGGDSSNSADEVISVDDLCRITCSKPGAGY